MLCLWESSTGGRYRRQNARQRRVLLAFLSHLSGGGFKRWLVCPSMYGRPYSTAPYFGEHHQRQRSRYRLVSYLLGKEQSMGRCVTRGVCVCRFGLVFFKAQADLYTRKIYVDARARGSTTTGDQKGRLKIRERSFFFRFFFLTTAYTRREYQVDTNE